MTKDKRVYLAVIHDCIHRIRMYTQQGKAAYFASIQIQDAVMRNIEIIGQAVKDFGVDELNARAASVPWKQIAGMRDMLAHRYLGVDIEMTWEVVERDLAPVEAEIGRIAADLGLRLPTNDH